MFWIVIRADARLPRRRTMRNMSSLEGPDMPALYIRIKEDILNKITNGTYGEGTIIPSEMELATMYNVSRPTIRQAVQLLVNEGYLEKRKRRGTVVCRPKVRQAFSLGIRSYEDEANTAGSAVETVVLLFKRTKANEEVASRLGVSVHDDVFRLVRVRRVDQEPNVLSETYISYSRYPEIDGVDFTTNRLYDVLEATGRPVVDAEYSLEGARADAYSAAILGIEEGDPLLILHTVGRNQQRDAAEYSISTYRGERTSFSFVATRI